MLLGKQQMDAMMNAMNNTVSAKNKISASGVQVHYGDTHAIKDVSVEILDKTVTAFIGPSGCGKSTFLRTLNRMNDTIDICRVSGDILLDGEDIYDPRIDPVQLRARVGMVFQKPNPFPKSIYDNVAYGPRIHGLAKNKAELDEIVEKALRRGAIWAFVCTKLLILPLLTVLAGGIMVAPLKFSLSAGFSHKKAAGRAEYLRAIIADGAARRCQRGGQARGRPPCAW